MKIIEKGTIWKKRARVTPYVSAIFRRLSPFKIPIPCKYVSFEIVITYGMIHES